MPDRSPTIGLVVPFARDEVPAEGRKMFPDVTFGPKGVGVLAGLSGQLTGYGRMLSMQSL